MSIALPLIDLSSAVVGTSGIISLNSVGVSAGGPSANPATIGSPPHVRLMNDSGCGLFIVFKDEGHTDHLGAGVYRTYAIAPGESTIIWTVEYLMNVTQPISKLLPVYYFPGESIDLTDILGNSPIGGGVNTSTIQTLQNDGSLIGTQFIESTPASGPGGSAITFTVDGQLLLKILISGAYHQFLKTQTSGSPLLLGQLGDNTEVLGSLLIDQFLNVQTQAVNTITINGSTSGTATLWQDCTGIIKRTLIFWNNFRNGGASNQDIALPAAYVNGAFLRTGELANFQLLSAGVAQTISTITVLAANGGSNSDAASMSAYGIGTIKVGFDTVRFPSGQANPHTGFISIDGH